MGTECATVSCACVVYGRAMEERVVVWTHKDKVLEHKCNLLRPNEQETTTTTKQQHRRPTSLRKREREKDGRTIKFKINDKVVGRVVVVVVLFLGN